MRGFRAHSLSSLKVKQLVMANSIFTRVPHFCGQPKASFEGRYHPFAVSLLEGPCGKWHSEAVPISLEINHRLTNRTKLTSSDIESVFQWSGLLIHSQDFNSFLARIFIYPTLVTWGCDVHNRNISSRILDHIDPSIPMNVVLYSWIIHLFGILVEPLIRWPKVHLWLNEVPTKSEWRLRGLNRHHID